MKEMLSICVVVCSPVAKCSVYIAERSPEIGSDLSLLSLLLLKGTVS
jgi:hypothetical protein